MQRVKPGLLVACLLLLSTSCVRLGHTSSEIRQTAPPAFAGVATVTAYTSADLQRTRYEILLRPFQGSNSSSPAAQIKLDFGRILTAVPDNIEPQARIEVHGHPRFEHGDVVVQVERVVPLDDAAHKRKLNMIVQGNAAPKVITLLITNTKACGQPLLWSNKFLHKLAYGPEKPYLADHIHMGSYGKSVLKVTIVGPVQFPCTSFFSNIYCGATDMNKWYAVINKYYRTHNIHPEKFGMNAIVWAASVMQNCDFAGSAGVGTYGTWPASYIGINGNFAYMMNPFLHELGHTLGMNHGTWGKVVRGGSIGYIDYGDGVSPMNAPIMCGFTTCQAWQMGWLKPLYLGQATLPPGASITRKTLSMSRGDRHGIIINPSWQKAVPRIFIGFRTAEGIDWPLGWNQSSRTYVMTWDGPGFHANSNTFLIAALATGQSTTVAGVTISQLGITADGGSAIVNICRRTSRQPCRHQKVSVTPINWKKIAASPDYQWSNLVTGVGAAAVPVDRYALCRPGTYATSISTYVNGMQNGYFGWGGTWGPQHFVGGFAVTCNDGASHTVLSQGFRGQFPNFAYMTHTANDGFTKISGVTAAQQPVGSFVDFGGWVMSLQGYPVVDPRGRKLVGPWQNIDFSHSCRRGSVVAGFKLRICQRSPGDPTRQEPLIACNLAIACTPKSDLRPAPPPPPSPPNPPPPPALKKLTCSHVLVTFDDIHIKYSATAGSNSAFIALNGGFNPYHGLLWSSYGDPGGSAWLATPFVYNTGAYLKEYLWTANLQGMVSYPNVLTASGGGQNNIRVGIQDGPLFNMYNFYATAGYNGGWALVLRSYKKGVHKGTYTSALLSSAYPIAITLPSSFQGVDQVKIFMSDPYGVVIDNMCLGGPGVTKRTIGLAAPNGRVIVNSTAFAVHNTGGNETLPWRLPEQMNGTLSTDWNAGST